MKKLIGLCTVAALMLTSCFGGKLMTANGGEVTGTSGRAFTEPTPYGMVLVKRGHVKMGIENQDSLWGKKTPVRDISVDGFWMDETEVTNSKYRQFVNYVRDSILRERLSEIDETYKTVKTDREGNEISTVLNWKKPLPRRPSEDEQEIIDAMYVTNPVTGDKMLDFRQLNYRYEVYDYTAAALTDKCHYLSESLFLHLYKRVQPYLPRGVYKKTNDTLYVKCLAQNPAHDKK